MRLGLRVPPPSGALLFAGVGMLAASLSPWGAAAQPITRLPVAIPSGPLSTPSMSHGVLESHVPEPAPPQSAPSRPETSPGRAALYSAVIPGVGQHVLGQNRKWVYLALETAGWIFYFDRRSRGSDLAAAYRDFAWSEARVQSGERIDGDFDYYERLAHWERSGLFDADPQSPGLQPETAPGTYNGFIWELASDLFLPGGPSTPPTDPGYVRALEYYAMRGYGTEFLWDWSSTAGAQEEYAGLISQSDSRYRQATNVLGAIIANHLVSAVDAFLSARGVPTPTEVRVHPMRVGGGGALWAADVRFALGR